MAEFSEDFRSSGREEGQRKILDPADIQLLHYNTPMTRETRREVGE
jgi:hypothetical protein